MNVIIMRGLPGAGKTTYVENLKGGNVVVCSADHYHMVDGVYKFNPKNSGSAHDKCLKRYLDYLLVSNVTDVIVDNTNTTLAELAPYARIASALMIPFRILYVYADVVEAFKRNKHGVSFATMLRMQQHLDTEQVPPYWPQEFVIG